MAKQQRGYLSYLLRLWRTGSEGDTVWRASLESPITGERQGFAGLEDLFSFLQAQLREQQKTKAADDDS